MYKYFAIIILGALVSVNSQANEVDGLVKMQSKFSVSETLDRLENLLEKKGITVAVRWKHSEKAANVDIKMRDTELLVFGNPKLGSHLMTSAQTVAIDLPMKAIAWKDAAGQVWLAYNDPAYIAKRHGVSDRDDIVKKMSNALAGLTANAAGK